MANSVGSSERTISAIPVDKREEEDCATSSLSNTKDKPTKIVWKEIDVPTRLQQHESYKEGDWKVFISKREDGRTDWKYIHQRHHKIFRSARGAKFFLDGKETIQMFEGGKLRNKKKNDHNGQTSGVSKPRRGRKAADKGTRFFMLEKPCHLELEKLPVGFI